MHLSLQDKAKILTRILIKSSWKKNRELSKMVFAVSYKV